eukprot:4561304-Pyramimonas_sp.AAC.2
MVKISVESSSDTILSSVTRVATATIVIGDYSHTLTTTTIEVTSRSTPRHIPPTTPTPSAPTPSSTQSPTQSPLAFYQPKQPKPIRKTRPASPHKPVQQSVLHDLYQPIQPTGVFYTDYTGQSWSIYEPSPLSIAFPLLDLNLYPLRE